MPVNADVLYYTKTDKSSRVQGKLGHEIAHLSTTTHEVLAKRAKRARKSTKPPRRGRNRETKHKPERESGVRLARLAPY